jgi:hypothetical protein
MVETSEYLKFLLCSAFNLRYIERFDSCIESLLDYWTKEEGRKEIEMAVLDKSFGPLLMLLCAGINHRNSNTRCIKLPGGGEKWLVSSTLRTWFSEVDGKSHKLKPSAACIEQLTNYITDKYRCYSFGTFVEDLNCKREQGWLRNQSMELVERFPPAIATSKKIKLQKGRLLDGEKRVLSAHICLLLPEKGKDTDALLSYAWGLSADNVTYTRLSLKLLLFPKGARQRDNATGPISPSFKSPPSEKQRGIDFRHRNFHP